MSGAFEVRRAHEHQLHPARPLDGFRSVGDALEQREPGNVKVEDHEGPEGPGPLHLFISSC
jgi:hypothetical protein